MNRRRSATREKIAVTLGKIYLVLCPINKFADMPVILSGVCAAKDLARHFFAA
jgi:hypothetical protein